MNLTLIIGILSIVVGSVTGFGVAWKFQSTVLEAQKHEYEASLAAARAAAQQATIDAQKRVITARDEAQRRAVVLRRDADRAAESAAGLRESIATAGRAYTTTLDACAQHAATIGQLLGDCGDRYRWLAATCDGHANDIKTLSDGWPK